MFSITPKNERNSDRVRREWLEDHLGAAAVFAIPALIVLVAMVAQ